MEVSLRARETNIIERDNYLSFPLMWLTNVYQVFTTHKALAWYFGCKDN